ncbi:MAG: efflux RND transporter periplasmic adaptor subunit [Candidatus Pelethousia sp.]|nr:efflux RND transporter periplasmic adaptor subunit [Candidatus Pelethousia sp.]
MRKIGTTKKGGAAGESIQQQLEGLLGSGAPRRKPPKWLWFAVGGGTLLLGGTILALVLTNKSAAASQATYREFTVQRGDVTVGSTESSSISLMRETIDFPVSTTIEEVYVKAGSYVEEGEPVMLLNVEQVQFGLASYELELEQAGLELEQAKLKQETGILEAQQKYDTAKQTGKLADSTEALSVAELQLALETAEQALEEATKEYDEYVVLNINYPYDYSTLCYYEEQAESYKSQVDTYTEQLSDYESLEKLIETLKKEISDSTTEANSLINDTDIGTSGRTKAQIVSDIAAANEELATREADFSNLQNEGAKSVIQSNLYDAQRSYTSANSTYVEYKTWYNEKYGNSTDGDDLATKVANLQTQVNKAALALTKADMSLTTGITTAGQKAETAATSASVAATELELAEMELQQAVDAAQEAYDALAAEIVEIKKVVREDGLVYAPCSGMVASVAFEAGDSFEVTYDPLTEEVREQTLLTLTDIANVYVPITISEEDVLDISIGQQASVTMTAFSGQTFDAEVDTVSVESSRSGAATVSYTVNVRFMGVNTQQMFEGMSAEVTLVQGQVQDVLYINAQCVTNTGGRAVVLVRGEDGVPMEREVKTGFSDGRYVEILSGLAEGETVLAESAVQP